jgi:hypothetical protein
MTENAIPDENPKMCVHNTGKLSGLPIKAIDTAEIPVKEIVKIAKNNQLKEETK